VIALSVLMVFGLIALGLLATYLGYGAGVAGVLALYVLAMVLLARQASGKT